MTHVTIVYYVIVAFGMHCSRAVVLMLCVIIIVHSNSSIIIMHESTRSQCIAKSGRGNNLYNFPHVA